MNLKTDYLFEVSWEVCNKVGGIHTVISSKVPSLLKFIKRENYFLFGPLLDKSYNEFTEMEGSIFEDIIEEIRKDGINVKFGTWNIPGKPYVFLIGYREIFDNKNKIKWELWRDYRIDSIRAGFDFDDPVVWGYAVYKFIKKLIEFLGEKKIYVINFHEWLAGSALLYLKKELDKGLVFTTHATVLGRTLASNGKDVHKIVRDLLKTGHIIDDFIAYKYNVEAKHLLEKQTAKNANVFTTVSDMIAKETKAILGRYPDVITYNGFNIKRYGDFTKILEQKLMYKKVILRFLKKYFYPFYKVDLKNAKLLYTSGRYEFRDKGFDIIIKALGVLDKLLDETVFFFFFVPTDIKQEDPAILENFALFNKIYDILDLYEEELKDFLIDNTFKYGKVGDALEISTMLNMLKKRKENPPLTPYIYNYPKEYDPILKSLKEEGLENRKENKVKVIVYPVYLDGRDKFLGLDYYKTITAMDIGIFPSYYEPWGYTPLEASIFGNITITTDCSGFGQSVKAKNRGIYVLERVGKTDEEVVFSLVNLLMKLIKEGAEDMVSEIVEARKIATNYDWDLLIKYYIRAYNMSIE